MLSAVSVSTETRGIALNTRSATMTGKSFGDILSESMNAKGNTEVPRNWRDSGRTRSVFEAVADYLAQEQGIDMSARVPTHNITDEQAEWLRSRHDLNSVMTAEAVISGEGGKMQVQSRLTDDYYNLLGDLVYLNIISPDEAKTLNAVQVPVSPGLHRCEDMEGDPFADSSDNEADSFIEAIERIIEKQKELVEFYSRKCDDPNRCKPEDIEYLERAAVFLEKKQEIYNVLQKLWERGNGNEFYIG